ncbi:two-component system sensor histidine kinase NtrB [Amaricoccus tamworthensis]|uniref:two-component system sensor histidine kinase NtrB n=1 Tax=Amaricoccus tamworthensis TaxID=57002 RepID=UPI003C7E60C5
MSGVSFDALWSAIPYPAFIVAPDDSIAGANPSAEEFGSTSEKQMHGKPVDYYLGANSVVMEVVRQARKNDIPVTQYNVMVGWLGNVPTLQNVHAVPMREACDKILILLHPQGRAAKMDRSLTHRSAARSVSGMAAMLAHEIRNPLAGISGAAQLLEMGLTDADRELTGLIRGEAERIGSLVDRVEKFGDLRPTQRIAFNIHDVLDRTRRSAQAGFANHVRFREDFDPSLPPALGDPDQMLQVFQNLMKNAAEALPPTGGLITVTTAFRPGVKLSRPGGRSESLPLLVVIGDNGPGIPDSMVADIFDPFVSSKVNGTGLGLSLVSKIISDHGGVVECESRPGRTRFLVRLPISRDEQVSEEG